MPVIAYNYQIAPGEEHLSPLCFARLFGPRRTVTVRALVDSGATYTIFDTATAADVGIVLPPKVNDSIRFGRRIMAGRRVEVEMALRAFRWRAEVIFVQDWDYPYFLLGRSGVFNQFSEIAFVTAGDTPRVEFRYETLAKTRESPMAS